MSETNPWGWYSDPDVLGLERERIFRSAWHYVVPRRPGAPSRPRTSPARRGGLPALVIRDQEGELRAFLNVCLHRGAVIATGEGHRETLQCPYHAWTYGLDGRLRSAPRSGEAELERLVACSRSGSRRWGPFLFVSADPDAEPLSIGGRSAVRPGGARLPRAGRLRARGELEDRGRELPRVLPLPGRASRVHEARRRRARRLPARGERRASGASTARRATGDGRCEFHLVWPALKINIYPGFANLSIGPVWPESPERTVGFLDYFFGADVPEEDARQLIEFDDQVGREDTALVESVQRGVRSGLIDKRPTAAGKRAADRGISAQGG